MKNTAAFVLVLIGVIIGGLGSLMGIGGWFLNRAAIATAEGILGAEVGGAISGLALWGLISSIIGVVLTIVLIIYTVKIAKSPVKKDYIVTTVLGALGIFLGMGLGGILVVIGGIIGIVKSK